MTTYLRSSAAVLAVASLGLLAACGSGEAAAAGADTEELRIAYSAQPATLDPHNSTAEATFDMMRGVYEGLVALDADGNPQPQLAESIDVNEDYSQFTFHLREVTFHDGSTLDSQDVIDSLNRWIDSAPAGMSFQDCTFEATDEHTVVMTSPKPFYPALTMLANHQNQYPAIMSSESIASAGTEGLQEFVGTGPYTFTEWVDNQYVHLTKYADYVAPEVEYTGGAAAATPVYENIYFDVVTDPSTRLAGFQTGDYDVLTAPVVDQIEQIEAIPGVNTETTIRGTTGFTFNRQAESIFVDQDLRKAVSVGLDMEPILAGAYGYPEYYQLDGALGLPAQKAWYTDAALDQYNLHDPAQAASLMQKAGYADEPVVILATRDYQSIYDTAVVVEQQLKELGFATKLEVYDWATMLDIQNNEPDGWDMAFSSWAPQSIPTRYTYMSSQVAGAGDNPEFYAAIDAVNHSSSAEEATEKLADLQEEFYRTVPMVKAGTYSGTIAWSEEIGDIDMQSGAGATGLYYNVQPAEG
ncbi:ABC transporter substrate-binding protein [Brevibacterium samyangense]|uniref:ABC transporter substrate-binding protein n=1 Tax=Brevibacterium samyangense TaxID=366888 RepID=A0ABP5ENE8_9MICO